MRLPIVRPKFPDPRLIRGRFDIAVERGKVTNNAIYVQLFEVALTAYLGVPTLAFSSGTAALTAMLMASDLNGGDVICPSFTFPATPAAIIMAGARPCFVDIEEEHLTIDAECVGEVIVDSVTAVLGVDVYGIPCDEDLLEESIPIGIPLMFDSAPAFGTTVSGKSTRVYSFHATKPFSTMEGGCVCSHDGELFDRVRRIRNFGLSDDGRAHLVGFNGKMTEVCALVGLEQLITWPETLKHRRGIAGVLRLHLGGISGITVIGDPPECLSTWTYQPILVDPDKFGMDRDALGARLLEKEIETRPYYGACHTMPAFHMYHKRGDTMPAFRNRYHKGGPGGPLPVTERVASQVLALPVYNDMAMDEIEYLAGAIRECQRTS